MSDDFFLPLCTVEDAIELCEKHSRKRVWELLKVVIAEIPELEGTEVIFENEHWSFRSPWRNSNDFKAEAQWHKYAIRAWTLVYYQLEGRPL